MTEPHSIATEAELRAAYKPPSSGALAKEIGRLDAHCRGFIALSPFLCLGTQSAAGRADVSPRGGEPGFVHVLADDRLAIPDRPGNNRLDSLTNIVGAPSVGLVFFVPGVDEVLRVNGRARISLDPGLMARFEVEGRPPRAVLLIEVEEAQIHCAKAIRRAGLWDPDARVERSVLPTTGEILRDHCRVATSAEVIDAYVEKDARENLY